MENSSGSPPISTPEVTPSEDSARIPVSVLDTDAFVTEYFSPKPNLTPKDLKASHWVVDWNELESRATGPVFEVGGHKWNILFFPQGNNPSDGCSSFFLQYTNAEQEPEGWGVCAEFCLVISNVDHPDVFSLNRTEHRFHAEEVDWGFSQFIKLDRLTNAINGNRVPLMVNNKVRLSVFVRVIVDPTGVLWHDFKNYDSRKVTGYVGLDNQGATCYMNSLLQSLYFTNEFRRAVYRVPTENDRPEQSVTLALQHVFYELQTSPHTVDTVKLTKSFGWDSQDSFRQHDVQEFNRVLQDHLENKMKGTSVEGAIGKLFLGKMKSYIRCLNVDFESSRIEDYYDISLNVKGCKTLRDSFEDYCQVETLEGENKYHAEGHGLQDAKKGMAFMSFPPVLHLQLKRFEYDFMYDRMVKINDRFEFPFEIDLGEFLASDAERDPSDPTVYCLHGVLVHSGDVSGGHYFAYLRPTEEDKWYRFDDDRVIPVLPEEVIDESYGGDLNGGNAPARTRPGLGPATRSVHKRITNAYMLVYIRKSRAKQILTPVSNDEIPQHLIKCLEEAKAEEERLRREYEERTRTLSVTVFDDNNFSRHQGFDMCYFDTQQPEDNPLYSKRFPRTMRYFEFKEQYAKERGLNKDDIRFWTLVGRVNKTVRLDAPIPERLIEPSDLIGEYNDQTLEKIYHDTFKKWSGLRLYCERKDEYVPQGEFVPCDNSTNLSLVLVKFYDPETQTMEGLGKVYVNAKQQIKDIIPLLRKKKGLSHDTELDLYEEIKPQLVERMDPEATFHKSEIQNGDIICFQLHRSGEDAADASHQQAMQPALRTVPEYFDRLTRQVPVMFCRYRPNDSDDEDGDEVSEANGGRADARTDAADPDAMETEEAVDNDEFELTLYSDDAYDTVAQAVARRIGVSDPLHLLFRRADLGYTKKQPIRRTPHTRLEDMAHFGVQHGRRQGYLYFEVLPMSIDEMENTTAVPVTFIGSSLRDEHVVKVRVNNNQSAQALIDSVHKRVQALKAKGNQKRQQQQQKGSNGVAADEDTSAPPISLRIYQEVMHRNIQPINPGEPVTTYLGHGSIIAEQFPSTSDHPLDKDRQYGESRVISVFQFTNYLRNTHGVPFVFTVFRDEQWEETWERIRVKLGMGKRDLTKVKAVVVPENASSVEQCRYIVGANVMHGNDMALVMPGGLQSPTPMDTPPRSVSPAPNNSEGTPLAEGRKEGDASTVPNQQQQQQHPTTLWEELAEGDTLALDYVDRYSKWRPTEKSIHIRS